jgi:hypothetical protein
MLGKIIDGHRRPHRVGEEVDLFILFLMHPLERLQKSPEVASVEGEVIDLTDLRIAGEESRRESLAPVIVGGDAESLPVEIMENLSVFQPRLTAAVHHDD